MLKTQSGRYSKTMLLQVAHFLVQLPVLAAALVGVLPEKAAAITASVVSILAAIGTAILRQRTSEPMGKAKPKVVTMLSALIVAMACGCGTTCKTLTIERHDHPELKAPAATIVWKCDDKTVKAEVQTVPNCLSKCWSNSND